MNTSLLILFRIVHVFAGALWIGAAISYLFFFKPSIKAIGPAGSQFMRSLAERRKYPVFMITTSLLTVLAGGALYIYASGGFNLAWIRTGPGLGFTIGALAGVAAFFIGFFGIGRTSAQMGALSAQIGSSGGSPTPDQINVLHALGKKLSRAELVDFVMLFISMSTMATARYWPF
ncbi:MAG: hypothetical protein GX495_00215 [Chloroflexi bacterium]|jgi:hypothetical protein|nr:hypothetical protein [Chloroflexota bacterium]